MPLRHRGGSLASTAPALLAAALVLSALPGATDLSPASAPVTCDGRVATIVGTPSADRLRGTAGPDVIVGLGGNDVIDGRGGADLICGGPGGDRLLGGPGADRLLSGPPAGTGGDHFGPADSLDGGPGDDALVAAGQRPRKNAVVLTFAQAPGPVTVDLEAGTAAGYGDDTITAQTWVRVVGSPFGDTLTGTSGRDWLEGRAGDDLLSGLAGDDRLDDGAGDDTLLGGPGADDLMIAFGHDTVHGDGGNDSIFGFDHKADRTYGDAGNDTIDLPVAVSADQEIAGGPGRDRAFLTWRRLESGKPAFTRVATDLTAGTWTFTDQAVVFPFSGLEVVHLSGRGAWTAVGTTGDDVYETGWETRLTASMGEGDDRVTGSRKGDTVDGGPGTDTVRPFGGHDVCISVERFPLTPCEETS